MKDFAGPRWWCFESCISLVDWPDDKLSFSFQYQQLTIGNCCYSRLMVMSLVWISVMHFLHSLSVAMLASCFLELKENRTITAITSTINHDSPLYTSILSTHSMSNNRMPQFLCMHFSWQPTNLQSPTLKPGLRVLKSPPVA